MRVVVGAVVLAALAVASDASAGDAPRAIAAIENDLVADDPAVRAKAAGELTDRFPDGAVAVPMLVDLLDDESPEVVAAAAKAIDSMAVAGATPLTKYFLDEKHWSAGLRTVEDLPVLLTLKAPSPADGLDWERIMGGKAPLVSSEDAAIVALMPRFHWRGDGWNVSTPLLAAAARQGTGEARTLAASALAMAGADAVVAKGHPVAATPARSAAAASALSLVKNDLDVRSWVGSRVLARVRSGDAAVVAALTQALTAPKKPPESRPEWRRQAARAACVALGAAGSAAAPAAPELLRVATDDTADIAYVYGCIDALLLMGKEPELVKILTGSGRAAERVAGALASRKKAAESVVPFLLAALERTGDPNQADDLAEYGPAASRALPALQRLVREAKSKITMLHWIDVILAISPADRPCANALRKMASDREPLAVEGSMRVIVRRATAETDFAPDLQSSLSRAVEGTLGMEIDEEEILDALARCGPAAKGAVPVVVKAIQEAEKTRADYGRGPKAALTYRSGVRALGAIGPDAAAAIPMLEGLRSKADETVCVPLAQALRRIKAKK